ncbi:MAG: methyltransferase, partial [Flavobacteriales bacterium]|nr:methyltransferase [Flavobacteriales bacterium]
ALMSAQRFIEASVLGIDTNTKAVDLAAINFASSKWSDRMQSSLGSFESIKAQFDMIICNPPYFQSGIVSKNHAKALARHNVSWDFDRFFSWAHSVLTPDGNLSIIVPHELAPWLIELSSTAKLKLLRHCEVRSKPKSLPIRSMLSFGHDQKECVHSEITISDEGGGYSKDFQRLTAEYYTIF